MKQLSLMAVLATIGIMLVGCSPEARDQYSNAGNDVGEATKKTGDAIVTDAENTKIAADNALKTASVKSALQAADGLDTKDINVDSDTKKMTVTLNGSVPSAAQKSQAEAVAKGIAGADFKVVNNLKTSGK